jgi:hypothetical protein
VTAPAKSCSVPLLMAIDETGSGGFRTEAGPPLLGVTAASGQFLCALHLALAADGDCHISHSCSLCMRADHFPARFAPIYGCGTHTRSTAEADVTYHFRTTPSLPPRDVRQSPENLFLEVYAKPGGDSRTSGSSRASGRLRPERRYRPLGD